MLEYLWKISKIKIGLTPNIAEVSSFCVVVLVLGFSNIDDTCGELTDVVKGCEVISTKVVGSVDSVVVSVVVITSVVVGTIVVVVFNVVVIKGDVDIMVVFSSGNCTIIRRGILI